MTPSPLSIPGNSVAVVVVMGVAGSGKTYVLAHWVARYTFAQTGRPVVNDVRSIFRFDTAGLIVDQQDDFDFWRWARQALGRQGLLLGWTPVLQHGVRDRAMAGLEAFRNR